jgi:hypothetical protein
LLRKVWKKTGIRFKISSLIYPGSLLELFVVISWDFSIFVNDFVFSILFMSMILFSPFLFSLLACSLRSLVYFRVRCEVMVRMWAGSCVGVHEFLWCDLVVGVLMSWVHVFSVISVVLVSFVFWCSWGWGLFLVCFSCLIVVWVVAWGIGHALLCCVRVVICFCRLLSFVSLSPPSWWTISVVYFVSLLERGRIGRGLLSRRLVRHRRWCPQR